MSSSEWNEVKLGDLVEVSSSKRIYAKEYVDSGIPFYRSKEVIQKSKDNDVSTELYISKERFNELRSKFGVPSPGDILLTSVGTLGVPYIVRKEEFYFKDGNLTWIKKFKDNCHNGFIFYWLLSPDGINQINTRCIGSTQKALTIDTIKKFELKIPSFEEQKAIANILSTLDEKIEVNNQINKTLENMAQEIFKRWFVDFEFPNEDGEPYKSSGGEMVESEFGMIPKGWEVISLDKIVDVKSGYSYKGTDLSESNNAMVTIKNFDRNGGYKTDGLKEIIISDRVKAHHYIEANEVVVAHTDLTQGAEIIGNPVMVFSKGKYDKLIMSMDVVKVTSKDRDIDNAFVYCLLKNDSFKQHALGYVNGTTVLHLSKKAIPQYKLPFPVNNKICKELSRILKNIMMRISLSVYENDNLSLTRDALLPKLMSGEIRVPLDEEGDAQ